MEKQHLKFTQKYVKFSSYMYMYTTNTRKASTGLRPASLYSWHTLERCLLKLLRLIIVLYTQPYVCVTRHLALSRDYRTWRLRRWLARASSWLGSLPVLGAALEAGLVHRSHADTTTNITSLDQI